ncbi:T9SS type A sorting domain-containing protein, partial [bacterium AH-315-M05]|nr:T9SS type A sorting domain-containing protein [bacterium AH-315-M05]
DLPVDVDLQLGVASTGSDLFRNNDPNTNYPYTLPGYLSITAANAPADYYYFYYDWEVREPICISERAQVTATINQEPTAAISASTNPSCNGSCDGDATVSGSGGTPPYTYLWSPSGQTGLTNTALCAGQHDVIISDINGCTDTTTATITDPADIALAFSSVDATCGSADGEASVSVSNGVAPYTYLWDDFNVQTTPAATGLPAGTYAVIVTDANGCIATDSVIVNNSVPVVSISAVIDVSCNGASDGQATASASGGASPYTYQWYDPDSQTTATATGLMAGTYTITVIDFGNCFSTTTVTINEPQAITLTLSSADASCGNADGQASVTASNGVTPYTYLWNDPSTQTTATATGLAVGTYTVLITDANGCAVSGTVSVNDAGAPVVTLFSSIDVSCNGGSDGEATISASGGIMPYAYLWDDPNAQTTVTATGLTAGTYTITVTDFSGCVGSAVITINEPLPITLALSSVDATCGNADGQASVIASGGNAPYAYQWDDPGLQTTFTATGLFSGSYTVTITDANGCTTNGIVAVNNSVPVVNISSSLDVSCSEGNDGEATVAASGGTPSYTYSWSTLPVQTTATATGLVAGTYTVSVTDAAGCVANAIVIITEPAQIALTTDSIDANCGQPDGGVSVSATGGTGAYSYLWDDPNSSTTASVSGLAAGTYSVVVMDANGCTATASAAVNDIPVGTASISASANASCNGVCDGSATITSGGTAPYTYSWNDPLAQTTATANSLCAGTYNVTVTDSNGCTANDSVTITEPAAPDITTFSNDATPGTCDGNAIVSVNGGTPPYAYQWDTAAGSQTTDIADSLCPGVYTVTVTDANGCTFVDSVSVGSTTGINEFQVPARGGQAGLMFKVYPNPNTGEFEIELTILKKQDIEIKLLNIAGQLIFREKIDDLSGSYHRVFDVKDYAKGVYTLQITTSEGVINKMVVVE